MQRSSITAGDSREKEIKYGSNKLRALALIASDMAQIHVHRHKHWNNSSGLLSPQSLSLSLCLLIISPAPPPSSSSLWCNQMAWGGSNFDTTRPDKARRGWTEGGEKNFQGTSQRVTKETMKAKVSGSLSSSKGLKITLYIYFFLHLWIELSSNY